MALYKLDYYFFTLDIYVPAWGSLRTEKDIYKIGYTSSPPSSSSLKITQRLLPDVRPCSTSLEHGKTTEWRRHTNISDCCSNRSRCWDHSSETATCTLVIVSLMHLLKDSKSIKCDANANIRAGFVGEGVREVWSPRTGGWPPSNICKMYGGGRGSLIPPTPYDCKPQILLRLSITWSLLDTFLLAIYRRYCYSAPPET